MYPFESETQFSYGCYQYFGCICPFMASPDARSRPKSVEYPASCAILTLMAASRRRSDPMKPTGFLLLITGWILTLSAVVLLKQEAARGGFTLAGLGVEALGLVLVVRAHIAPRAERN
jgi:hypothetical protein